MGRTTGRSPEDTRRLVLQAAGAAIRRHGVGATLDLIAREAGVSKGGLVYHFASKEALLVALAQGELDAFDDAVRAHLEGADGTPGRLVRAYVRASLAPVDEGEALARFTLIAQLLAVPAVLDLARADDRRWQAALSADGVPEAARTLVLAAADGIGGRPLWAADLLPPVRERLEADLLEMVDAALGSDTATAARD
ncbi:MULTISPECIES: TetR/AcrR family transcriptional regulator [Pseudonocardia]|uniref:HTH-type transcriptional regulator RutR n=2 Tax=Pseudonocardia TaxID=1847 RepID=A0A1Y2MLJ4_PSEAH|nr:MULTISPECIES: TetR family transcriptional regulator [Pseudonocardia]OSY35527.1 HTH-type transcriptional regulator RutR [Pseudonocardia autotrophica]TDN76348.1 TetR family transcriptional regulator [Pseudonocardia autotrophica]BBG00332.1 TetR family transcriptional regulator [Pseudonocardia autotrophica]GEC27477.1 TetR family transcriptional regulator [Pseudonocardia saturnea]